MDPSPRHQQLIDALARKRFLHLDDAIALTGASIATVRRDFVQLSEQGLAQRYRGGIRLPQNDPMTPLALRDHLFSEEKHRLAQQAAALLRPGDIVFVDGGTTTSHLAACLPAIPLRIITNSVRLAALIDERHATREIDLYLTGGSLHPRSGLLVGPSAAASIDQYRAHWAFLSVGGLTREGLFNTTESVVDTERRMIARAEQVAVLADHSKMDRTAMCRVCGLDEIDYLITDAPPQNPALRDKLAAAAVQTVIASAAT
jgi:DeoR/GlpR family transcriptional regulator of sugar metabolism